MERVVRSAPERDGKRSSRHLPEAGCGGGLAEDVERRPISYDRLALGSLVLGRRLATFTEKGEFVGVMLPNAVGTVVTFFALQAFGRVPAILNFSTGSKNMRSAIESTRMKTVLTSRRFVEMASLQQTLDAIADDVDVVYLDDLKAKISVIEKLHFHLAGR